MAKETQATLRYIVEFRDPSEFPYAVVDTFSDTNEIATKDRWRDVAHAQLTADRMNAEYLQDQEERFDEIKDRILELSDQIEAKQRQKYRDERDLEWIAVIKEIMHEFGIWNEHIRFALGEIKSRMMPLPEPPKPE